MSEIIETGWLSKIPVGTLVEVVGESQVRVVDAAPVDWPARFRAAAEAAERADYGRTGLLLRDLAVRTEHLLKLGPSDRHPDLSAGVTRSPLQVVEAIWRALNGEEPDHD